MLNRLKKTNILLVFKAGLGSAIAIFLANRLNLLYSASAGIITLLTIQNTKIETISIAFKRIISFFLGFLIAFIVFFNFGYTTGGFGLFIFIFVAVSNLLKLQSGISITAVLVTHFLIEKNMTIQLIFNEVMLLFIGVGVGVLINLFMPNNDKQIVRDQRVVEAKIKSILSCMAKLLKADDSCLIEETKTIAVEFKEMSTLLENLLKQAYENADNRLLKATRYRISYLEMRRVQVAILKDIAISIENLSGIFSQSIEIANFLEKMSTEFHELNNVEDLLLDLEHLYALFREDILPANRIEFENRAILFNILGDLKRFLLVKHSFIDNT
ncbi:MAG: aromatic acid exporter family protein [Erysipelothrix sp.]|nr:aromatic acid exporter family protein [Erysipelothrix sp.]